MEILHDQIFIESTKQVAEYMNFMKQEIERTRDAKDIQNDIFSKEMLDLLKSYKKLCTRYWQYLPWKNCQILDDLYGHDTFVLST